jgi:hypothetical protein
MFGSVVLDVAIGMAFVYLLRRSSKHIQWAPDGDEAFDDGSYVLQFDVGGEVRLIAFKRGPDGRHDSSTLNDLWIASDEFYAVLRRWRDSFTEEWAALPKVAE